MCSIYSVIHYSTSHTSINLPDYPKKCLLQSAYYKRFEELHITEGSGKSLEPFGKSRAIYNQNAIGITTTPTLREILRLRAEHIRECPECNDNFLGPATEHGHPFLLTYLLQKLHYSAT
jgi:hypothetical protein